MITFPPKHLLLIGGVQSAGDIPVKLLLGTPLPVFVLFCGLAVTQTLGLPPSAAQAQEPNQKWGPITKGVRAGLSTDKIAYPVGEDIPLHITLENVSANAPIYDEPFRPRPAFGDFSSISIKITVQDEDGPLTPRWDSPSLSTTGGPSLCPAPYLSGKPAIIERNLRLFGLQPRIPGTYKITVNWSPYTTDIKNCDSVSSSGPAAQQEKPYVSVMSNPIFLEIVGPPSSDRNLLSSQYTACKRHFLLTDTSFGEKTALLDKKTHLEWI